MMQKWNTTTKLAYFFAALAPSLWLLFSLLMAGSGDSQAAAGGILLTIVVGIAGFLTFLPAMIAGHRWHKNRNAIFVLTFLLGWTGIGWIAALVWAFTNQPEYASATSGSA